ncbi:MAG: hypothetical protein FWB88_01385 [Defluviitaleaceae bacterium]|nr:hypothetical protein [Defluviitaleaceae bacterium]MCL2238952.1 hypothetical protein [Defluviitaleaceae bacterium]MCL2240601.1 hypothetical protein [Defluviitaleaceae bacterium]
MRNNNYFKENNLYNKKSAIILFVGAIIYLIIMIIFGFTEFRLFMIVLMFFSAIDGAFPQFLWTTRKIKISLSANIDDNIEPSDFYLFMRKIVCFGSLIFGYTALAFIILAEFSNTAV